MVGADKIIGVDLNPAREGDGAQVRHDPLRQPQGRAERGGPHRPAHRRRRRLLVRVHRQHAGHAPGAGVLRTRAGAKSIIIGVAAAGAEISTRPFQLVTGREWKGSAFGGARGRTDVPKIVDWYMEGKLNIDDLITHTLPLERINEGFDLMKRGESIRSVVLY